MPEAKIQWRRLTDCIINTPALQDRGEECDSILFDQRLEVLIERAGQIFDCIVISHIPLSSRGEDISQEDSESRCWIRGKGRYSVDTCPTSDQMECFLFWFVQMIKDVYDKKEGLFLHPFFFQANHFPDLSAPLCCQSIMESDYNKQKSEQKSLPKDKSNDSLQNVLIDSERGYHHTASVTMYLREDILNSLHDVHQRVIEKKYSYKEDVEICMRKQHKLAHDYLCSFLYQNQSGSRASSFVVCPTSLLVHHDSSKDRKISLGIAGMFWLTLIARNNTWGEQEMESTENIIRAVWLLAISDHLYKRHVADIQKGAINAMTLAAHDMSRMVGAIRYRNAEIVLKTVRDYFNLIISEVYGTPLELVGTESKGSVIKWDVIEILQAAKKSAVEIEQIVNLSKSDGEVDEARALNAFGEMNNWLDKYGIFSNIFNGLTLTCALTDAEKNAFELALIEALRNVIRPMWIAYLDTKADGEISIANDNAEDPKSIVINNKIILRFPTPPKGINKTEKSLKSHAKGYTQQRVKLVRVMRMSSNKRDDGFFEEEWTTVVPLPDNVVLENR